MTDRLRAAAEAALEAITELEYSNSTAVADKIARDAKQQLRAALAEQAPCDMGDICIGCTPRRSDGGCPGEQKPAAWIREDTAITTDAYQAACWRDSHTVTPLYAEPPRREWVGLTDEERKEFAAWMHPDLLDRVERLLKEKNHD